LTDDDADGVDDASYQQVDIDYGTIIIACLLAAE